MQVGFIGAGKAGFTLGKYFVTQGIPVGGYYSRREDSAIQAANFTETKCYQTIADLVEDNDVLFLTVPDNAIGMVWNEIKMLPINEICVVHCSGSLSSAVFSGIKENHCYGCSVHPLFAISQKYTSYLEMPNAVFTMEGDAQALDICSKILSKCGNDKQTIRNDDKVKYHAAAVFASNLMVGLTQTAISLMEECGFPEEIAKKALYPLMKGNLTHIFETSTKEALTGPVERNDIKTIERHLEVLSDEQKMIYKALSGVICDLAQEKYPNRDMKQLKEMIEYEKYSNHTSEAKKGK